MVAPGQPYPYVQQQAPPPRDRRWLWLLVGAGCGCPVVGIIGILIMSTAWYAQLSPAERKKIQEQAEADAKARESKEKQAEEAIAIRAYDLVRTYDENEVAADKRFKGKWVQVTGPVDNVGKELLGKPYVVLEGPSSGIRSVQCMFTKNDEDQLAALKKGRSVTIVGHCTGLMMNVLLEDCRIVGQ